MDGRRGHHASQRGGCQEKFFFVGGVDKTCRVVLGWGRGRWEDIL